MTGNWWDAVGKADENTGEGVVEALTAVVRGLQNYQYGITAMFNATPNVDKPIFCACLKLTYEAVVANDPELRMVTEAILDLPIETVSTRQELQKGGESDGV